MTFFGFYDHPGYEDLFIVPAIISDNGISNKIALLSFDSDLNVVDIKKISFENQNMYFCTYQIPVCVFYNDEKILVSLVRLSSGDYAHCFASINIKTEN